MDPDNGDQPGKAVAYGDAMAETSVGMNYAHAEAAGTRCAAAVSGGREDGAYGVVSGQGAYIRITRTDPPAKKKKPKKPVSEDKSAALTTPNEIEARDVRGGQHQVNDSASVFGTVIQGRPALNAEKQSLDINVGPQRRNIVQAAVYERDRTSSNLNGVNSSTIHPDETVEKQQRRSRIPVSSRALVWGGAVVVLIIAVLVAVFIIEGPEPTPPIIHGEHRSFSVNNNIIIIIIIIIIYYTPKCHEGRFAGFLVVSHSVYKLFLV